MSHFIYGSLCLGVCLIYGSYYVCWCLSIHFLVCLLTAVYDLLVCVIGRGGRFGRTRASRAGDRGFEPMVESNQ